MLRAACVWLFVCVGCNGAGGSPPPSEAQRPTTPVPSSSTSGGRPHPAGDAQPQLPLGKVVLETPPRAPVELSVEVAATPEARRMGLMFREELGDDEGMFFLFDEERPQSFWMRNTLLPLDMFFIDADLQVVGVVENATPLTDAPRRVDGDSQYVLEVKAGFAAEHGFGAGTQLRYTPPSAAAGEN